MRSRLLCLLLLLGVAAETRAEDPAPASRLQPPRQIIRSRIEAIYAVETWYVERLVGMEFPADMPATLRPLRVRLVASVPTDDAAERALAAAAAEDASKQVDLHMGPAQAVLGGVDVLWSAARSDIDRLEHGFPGRAGGLRQPSWPDTMARVPHRGDSEAIRRDGRAFFRTAPPDDLLLLLLPIAVGAWRPGEERERPFTFRRGSGLQFWRGTLLLRAAETEADRARLTVEVTYGGPCRPAGGSRIERKVSGAIEVTPAGLLLAGHLEVVTTLSATPQEHAGEDRILIDLAPVDAPPAGEPEHAVVARYRALQRSDAPAFTALVLEDTLARMCRCVEVLRPGVNLGQPTGVAWTDEFDAYAAYASAPMPYLDTIGMAPKFVPPAWLAFESAMGYPWRALRATLKAREEGESDAAAIEADAAGACALPHLGQVAVKPAHVGDAHVAAHELAHLAHRRTPYVDLAAYALDTGKDRDPAWMDADAVAACTAFDEGQATLTEFCAASVPIGPATIGRIARRVLQTPRPEPTEATYRPWLTWLAYKQGAAFLATRHREGESLEATIRRAGKAFSGQTREILYPDAPTTRSTLYPRALALKGASAEGASRVGAFYLRLALTACPEGSTAEAIRFSRDLEDDVVVLAHQGVLWVLCFTDAETANAFVEVLKPVQRDGHRLLVRGRHVIVTGGACPEYEDWLKVLLPLEGGPDVPTKTPKGETR